MSGGKTLRYALAAAAALALAAFLRQRLYPIPLPPRLSFVLENPITEHFVGSEMLLERLELASGMRVLDAGCGPGRLTIPLAHAVGEEGLVVALDSQSEMLREVERRVAAEGLANIRPVRAGLGEGSLEEHSFDRILLAMALSEARDRPAALRELYTALKPGGVLSVTEVFGDLDYRLPATVRREAEAAGFRLVARHGAFPACTLNFTKP